MSRAVYISSHLPNQWIYLIHWGHEDIPSSQVTVYKTPALQVLHPIGYLYRVVTQRCQGGEIIKLIPWKRNIQICQENQKIKTLSKQIITK